MRIEPITCLRPVPERAAEFVALPYDVFTDAEARAYVAEHPTSFLAIDRPETSFEEGHDPQAPEVYERAVTLLRERQLDGTLVRDEKPCLYLCELTTPDGHRQTGVLCAIATDDYLDGTLRKHELTLAHKEEDRVRHIEGLRAQTGPVFVAFLLAKGLVTYLVDLVHNLLHVVGSKVALGERALHEAAFQRWVGLANAAQRCIQCHVQPRCSGIDDGPPPCLYRQVERAIRKGGIVEECLDDFLVVRVKSLVYELLPQIGYTILVLLSYETEKHKRQHHVPLLKERAGVLGLPQYISALEQYVVKIQRLFFCVRLLCHIVILYQVLFFYDYLQLAHV